MRFRFSTNLRRVLHISQWGDYDPKLSVGLRQRFELLLVHHCPGWLGGSTPIYLLWDGRMLWLCRYLWWPETVFLQPYYNVSFYLLSETVFLQPYYNVSFYLLSETVFQQPYYNISFHLLSETVFLQPYYNVSFYLLPETVFLQPYYNVSFHLLLQPYYNVSFDLLNTGAEGSD